MKLTWPQNNFISKELYAPFVVKTDYEYYNDLRNKYLLFLKQAKMAGADRQSIKI